MSKEKIGVSIHLVDGQAQFAGEGGGHPPVIMDAYPPTGQGDGYSPLDMLLFSLASCTGMTLVSLLRARMRREVTALSIRAEGVTREVHPMGFTHITLRLTIATDASEDEIARALDSAEKKVCPVWSMLKGNVAIDTTVTIEG